MTTPFIDPEGGLYVAAPADSTVRPIPGAEPGDAMLDLETCGRQPFCPILTIGCCAFYVGATPGGEATPATPIADVFYQPVTLESCLELGMRIDAETLAWWMGAEDSSPDIAARKAAFFDPKAVALDTALDAFTDWLNSRPMKLWGNSARFDLGILEAAYKACSKQPPWHFRNERCYRTIKSLPAARDVEVVRFGTFHNALDDAITQAMHLRSINTQLNLQL